MNQTISRLNAKKVKKAPMFYTGAALLMLMLTVQCSGIAFALEGDLGNQVTGPNSENTNTVDQNINISFSIKNKGEADNNLDVDLNTGNNSVGNNTSVGNVETGDIRLASDTTNVINSNPSVDLPNIEDLEEININGCNDTTGPNSENENEINSDVDFAFDIENIAEVKNDYDLTLDTGNNDISHNTLVGDIETGDILAYLRLENYLNSCLPPTDVPIVPPVVPPVVPPPYNAPVAEPITPVTSLELPAIERALGAAPSMEFASIPAEFFPAGTSILYLLSALLLSLYISKTTIKKLRKVNI